VKKADYRKIAEYFDDGRTSSGPVIDLWMGLIGKYVQPTSESRILDIGCGTGRFTLPMRKRFNCRVAGADSSEEMLDKARTKDVKKTVQWDVQDIHNMTYGDGTFDAVFMSNLVHHCESPVKALNECYRVLDKNGMILVRHGSLEQISEDVTHTFFPETLPIDEARVPDIGTLERWLEKAGFAGVTTEEVEQKTCRTGEEVIKIHALKSTSVLSMISEDSFQYGMEKLTEYIKDNPGDPWLFYDKFSLTTGYRM
jgi:ubiquinone/menaquinone biosynthesis C-methylase UbiE